VLESLRLFLLFFMLLERTGFFWKASLVLGEKLARCGSWLRRLLAGQVSKQLSTAACLWRRGLAASGKG
jgi:hypothetical protein